ncbi:MAG: hypothetical protein AB7V77_01380 [Candidatus Woesearchaeota archaeon]
MDLTECFKKQQIIKINFNEDKVNSLIEISDLKEEVVKQSIITDRNISVFVSLAYDSLRELLEAICLFKCYKVISHICIGALLKEIIIDFDYVFFDEIRKKRNGINYYGTKIDFQQGKKIIQKIFKFKKKLMKNLNLKK